MCSENDYSSDSSEDKTTDDLITLGELTQYENSVWKFPDTKRCPVRSCGMLYRTRAQAIAHYRETHAKHGYLCKICKYPLMLLTGPHHLAGHFARLHPTETPPPKVKFTQHECPMCHGMFKNYVSMYNHMNNVHRSKSTKKKPQKRKTPRRKEENRAKATSKPSGNSDKMTVRSNSKSSWEDMGSEVSFSADETSETVTDPQDAAMDSSTQEKSNSLRRLVKRNARSFNLQNKSRPCTICGRSLKNYVLACNHYRQAHGRTVSMCPFCHKYFTKSLALIQHMSNHHQIQSDEYRKCTKVSAKLRKSTPTAKVDNNVVSHDKSLENSVISITENEPSSTEHSDEPEIEVLSGANASVNNDDTTEDDIIILGQMTEYSTERWKFPDTTACPRTHCKKVFDTRAEAIRHFRNTHSLYDVLCKECNRLVSLSGGHNLLNHYKRSHPNVEIPAKRNENKTACQVCQKVLSFQQMRIHMLAKHNDGPRILPSKVNKNDRTLKRKSLHSKRTNSEPRHKDKRALLRSKSICHPGYSATIPAPSEDVDKSCNSEFAGWNDLDQSHEQQIHDTPQVTVISSPQPNSEKQPEFPSCDLVGKLKTRSMRVRNKGCTICGMVLLNYVAACDHYHRVHGRNVLMCPYCEQYFMQSHLLTKHVMATHSQDNVYAESAKKQQAKSLGSGTTNDEQDALNDFETQNADTLDAEAPASDDVPAMQSVDPTTMEPTTPELTTVETEPKCDQIMQPDDEPLNLTIPKNDDQNYSIDLSSGALDLSLKK